jgi:7-cyano-7-deazaguanine synthase
MVGEAQKAVVMLSGGIDSTVLLHLLRRQGYCLFGLAFNYGQRHSRELECAQWQARQAGVEEFHLLRMEFMGDLLKGGSALLAAGDPVPDLAEIPENLRDQPPTYVPNRNMLLLSIGAAYAESVGASLVFYGAQAQDEYGYWDCTTAFLERINALLALNRRSPVEVVAPLIRNSKEANVRLGAELGVDFSRTWSCYRGASKSCGTCPTCVERLNAFRRAGIPDPIPYQHGFDLERPGEGA